MKTSEKHGRNVLDLGDFSVRSFTESISLINQSGMVYFNVAK